MATVKTAISIDKTYQLNPVSINAQTWNHLCWLGSVWQQAVLVKDACEQAVNLTGDDEVAMIRDSRGVNRALLEDYAGAIEDFEAFVTYYRDDPNNTEAVAQREAWIADLKAGKNPFDADTLRSLRE